MSHPIFRLLIDFVVTYIGLCVALFLFQRFLIYSPQPRSFSTHVTTLTLPTAEASVLVSARPHDGPKALLYFGGNAEDVSLNLPSFSAAFPEHAIYLLHYRGYGGSTGRPSEEALLKDALALFDKVRTQHQHIAIIGRSLGTGIAIHLASLRPASKLVLVTPYDSLQELASIQYPFIPVQWLLLDKYESWRYAPQITIPTVILAAEHDEVIPRMGTDRLYSRFKQGIASFHVIAGTSHNTISHSPQYIQLLKSSLP